MNPYLHDGIAKGGVGVCDGPKPFMLKADTLT